MRTVAIVGVGLIGGSFGLALKRAGFSGEILGVSSEAAIGEALRRGAIDRGLPLAEAAANADLIYIAQPIGRIMDTLRHLDILVRDDALITDAGSTKSAIVSLARKVIRKCQFLGGHPMAGKEISGIAAADANLFRGAKYALIGDPGAKNTSGPGDARISAFVTLIQQMGAAPVWLDAESHDRAAAIVSHLPQLLAVALAGVVRDHTDETGLPLTLAGRGLRDALRLAGSPYSVWRDIILTNSDNLDRVLEQFIQALEQLRGDLRTRALEDEFAAAGEIYRILRDLQ